MMEDAINKGAHVSALALKAITELQKEVAEKMKIGQARMVEWINGNIGELKVLPVAMIPYKS